MIGTTETTRAAGGYTYTLESMPHLSDFFYMHLRRLQAVARVDGTAEYTGSTVTINCLDHPELTRHYTRIRVLGEVEFCPKVNKSGHYADEIASVIAEKQHNGKTWARIDPFSEHAQQIRRAMDAIHGNLKSYTVKW